MELLVKTLNKSELPPMFMERKTINVIVETYQREREREREILTPEIGDMALAKRLTRGLQRVLAKASIEDEITEVEVPDQIGDVYFIGGRYGTYRIGDNPDSPVRGRTDNASGRILLYLLANIGKGVSFEDIRQNTHKRSRDRTVMYQLKNQLFSSAYFSLGYDRKSKTYTLTRIKEEI